MTKYYEDYQVGENFNSPGRTMTEGEIAILEGIGRFRALDDRQEFC